ncbi:ribokinase [Agromyces intestinalis]|uniref:Ribokinase n=1 Tax=Agromyces intestinalis TaxID=2592652 RepID=A0A5C1YF76_9MICO|nr:ribokinase [Agromyces intestinalis]QEO14721.1 ribokinase [Agromyces intestinalis]
MSRVGRVIVVGSLNVDSTAYVRGFPAPGETITAHGLRIALGGKGTNQAVAAQRFGAEVGLLARVGDDANAHLARDTLAGFGLAVDGLGIEPDAPTGVALITVADSGENTVIVASGANERMSPAVVDEARERIAAAAAVLTQGELPVGTIERLAAVAREAGTRFVLNLAPPVAVSGEALAAADPLVVNEHEARAVGIEPGVHDDESELDGWLVAASAAVARGLACSVVVTLGAAGAVAAEASAIASRGDLESSGDAAESVVAWAQPSLDVTPVDSTGAGDGFTGTLAAALAAGHPLVDAVRFATAAGALAVQQRGTVDSYADRDAVIAAAAALETAS